MKGARQQSARAPKSLRRPIKSAVAIRRTAYLRAVVDRGGDPQNERDRRKAMPTFEEFVRDEFIPFAKKMGKRSVADDEAKLRMYLIPKLGKLRLSDIAVRDVQEHHAAMAQTHAPATANKHLALLSAIMRKAVEWEYVDRNPCSGVKQLKENNTRQEFLSVEQCAALVRAMADEPNKTAAAALHFLLLTAARREEALQARWENLDLDRGTWHVPHTKAGHARTRVLSSHAIDLLRAQPSRGVSPWVFPGRDPSKPISNVRKAFERLQRAVGLTTHARIHDLRHAAAAAMASRGASLLQIQVQLFHATPKMTMRYAHLSNEAQRAAAETVGTALEAARAAESAVAP